MTIASACNRDLRTNRMEANTTAPACTEQRRVPHPGHLLHRRRLRCHHAHRLRVSWVLLARLSPLSSASPGNPRQVIGPEHGGCLSHLPGQSPVSERPRVHGGAIASHRRPRGRDPLLRLHQSLPLGGQECLLPRGAPGVHLRPRHRGPPSVLWFGQMYRAASPRPVPSCPALSHRGQTDLPTVSDLRGKPDPQRALTGTWCTPELHKAVEQGYVVLKILEVWHSPQSRQGLFAEYVNTWLKIKEETSGWPASCRTQESRAQHLHDYARREGIHLDYDQV